MTRRSDSSVWGIVSSWKVAYPQARVYFVIAVYRRGLIARARNVWDSQRLHWSKAAILREVLYQIAFTSVIRYQAIATRTSEMRPLETVLSNSGTALLDHLQIILARSRRHLRLVCRAIIKPSLLRRCSPPVSLKLLHLSFSGFPLLRFSFKMVIAILSPPPRQSIC